MRENTPPASPYQGLDDDDDELVYVGDDIDEVIDQLEEIPDNENIDDEDGKQNLYSNFFSDSLNFFFKMKTWMKMETFSQKEMTQL